MEITFDHEKRAITLKLRGLDMADAGIVFDNPHVTFPDDRMDYGETRYITAGHVNGRMVVIVWTQRGDTRRIINIRKANEREHRLHGPRFG